MMESSSRGRRKSQGPRNQRIIPMNIHRNIFRSFAFRLTLSLAILIGVISTAGVTLIYVGVFLHLRNVVDADLASDVQEFSRSIAIYGHDPNTLNETFVKEAEEDGTDMKFLRLISTSGNVIAESDMSSWTSGTSHQARGVGSVALENGLETIQLADERKARVITGLVGAQNFLQIGIALDNDEEFLADFRSITALVLCGMLGLGACVGWWMTRKAMNGIGDITKTTARIAEGNFSDRVHVTKYGAEIELLGTTFNRMAEKVETLIHEMAEVNNNIAHDLRSPIARVRVLAESIAMKCDAPRPGEDEAAGIIENCDVLTSVIDTMLTIAEIEAGTTRMEPEGIDLQEVVREAHDLFQPVAEEKSIALNCRIAETSKVRGDRRKIQRGLANLIDNALKYTDRGGEIVVSLDTDGDRATIGVEDNGIGIDCEERDKVFERFYRCDHSRTRPGSGLGLSLAMAVARAHNGDIAVESRLGEGSTFRFVLPTFAHGAQGL